MPINNAINTCNKPYYFCVGLTSDKLNVTGDAVTYYTIPYDNVISDAWGIYNPVTYEFTLPKSGWWIFGMSIKYTANYSTFNDATVALTTTLGAPPTDTQAYFLRYMGEGGGGPTNQCEVGFAVTSSMPIMAGHSFYPAIVQSGTVLKAEYTVWLPSLANDAGILYDASHPTMAWGYLLAEMPTPF